jgi:inorganic pyrophosphatase
MEQTVTVVVEIPKGSRNKYEMNHETGRIKLDRMLFSSVHYPADYGFIEGTMGGDGDPLDALVLVEEATFPGCEIETRPVGVLRMADEKGEDEKILTVPVSDPVWTNFHSLGEVPDALLREIEHFFTIYKQLESKGEPRIDGWEDADAAWKVIDDARARLTEAER